MAGPMPNRRRAFDPLAFLSVPPSFPISQLPRRRDFPLNK